MDRRPVLNPPELEAEYSRPLKKRAGELAAQVAEINDSWAALARKKAEFRSADPAVFDPATGQGIVTEELKILQRDLAARKELLAFELEILAETRTLGAAARQKLKDQRAHVEQKLLSIGYTSPPPLSIEQHPEVIALSNRSGALQRRSNSKDILAFLEQTIVEIQAGLEHAKTRILSLAV